tara:strand:- start:97 stop:486 length:390 start_codon:yes stop_codon:yes gene_type:complete
MTTAPTTNSNAISSPTATDFLPWQGRSLDETPGLIADYLKKKAAKATADADFIQADAKLKEAFADKRMDKYWCDLSHVYDCPGVTFTASQRTTWPAECFSEELQEQMAAEKLTREPKVTTWWKAKVKDA